MRPYGTTVLLIGLFGLFSCATAPKVHIFDPIANLNGDYDTAWDAIVEFFAVSSLPISTIEKDSGLIVTDWMDASGSSGGTEGGQFTDCGGSGITVQIWTRGKFNVHLTEAAPGRIQLRVTCTYQACRIFGEARAVINCNSTGFLEKALHEYVRARLSGDPVPEVDVFLPAPAQA